MDGAADGERAIHPLRRFAREVRDALWPLLKVLVPVAVVVRLAREWGLIDALAIATEPLMWLVGLPPELGLAWAAALLTSIYGGLAAFIGLAPDLELTTAQVSVLAVMMLTAHSLPVESAIARQAGLRLRYTLTLRVVGAIVFGWLHHLAYGAAGLLQGPMPELFIELEPAAGWGEWWLDLGVQVLLIAAVIVALLLLLRLLRLLRIDAALAWLLRPLLWLIGIRREALSLTLVGALLGLSYGGGLLIKESRSGGVDRHQVLLAMSLICLCHALIEDSLLLVAFGAHWSAVFVGRTFCSLLAVALLAALLRRWPRACERLCLRPLPAPERGLHDH